MNPSSSLTYLYRPAVQQTGSKAPVIILLHGVGSNERDLFALSEQFDSKYAVYSLRAPLVLGPNQFAWFHVNFTEQGPLHNKIEAEASRKILRDFIHNLGDLNPDIDPGQITVLGFSQGTIMGLSLALTEPDSIKGLVAISGRTLQEIAAFSEGKHYKVSPHVLLLHGKSDSKLPYAHALNTEAVLKKAQISTEFKSYEAGHQITQEMITDIQQWLKTMQAH